MATCWQIAAHSVCKPYVHFVFWLTVFFVISHFGFEGGALVLIAAVPGHCLSLPISDRFDINLRILNLKTEEYNSQQ